MLRHNSEHGCSLETRMGRRAFFHSKSWENCRINGRIWTICSLKIVQCFLTRVLTTSHLGYRTCLLHGFSWFAFSPSTPVPLPFSSLVSTMATPPCLSVLCVLIPGAFTFLDTWITVTFPSRFSLSVFHQSSFSVTLTWIGRPFATFSQFPPYPSTKTSVTLYSQWLAYGSVSSFEGLTWEWNF